MSEADVKFAEILKQGQNNKKRSKKEANYRKAEGKKKCANCKHFTPVQGRTGTCDVVAGEVKKGYTSDYFEEE